MRLWYFILYAIFTIAIELRSTPATTTVPVYNCYLGTAW